jgi:hypothetical protein
MAKLPTTEEVDAATGAFEPYFRAVGKVVHEWNHLQEDLGKLFCMVAGIDHRIGLAIWNSLASDRGQRDMLRATIEAAERDEEWSEKFPKAKAGIEWLLGEADRIADRRNDAIHAPCSIVAGEGDFEIIAVSFFGNKRAKKLRGKDILREFSWYESSAEALKQHVRDVIFALSDARVPWPSKPRMPTLSRPQGHPA